MQMQEQLTEYSLPTQHFQQLALYQPVILISAHINLVGTVNGLNQSFTVYGAINHGWNQGTYGSLPRPDNYSRTVIASMTL